VSDRDPADHAREALSEWAIETMEREIGVSPTASSPALRSVSR
jgi:hypothetical protein